MKSEKKVLICCVCILVFAIAVSIFPVHGEAEIYDTVVRLHVLANSDSEEDQSLKLKVRDEVVAVITPAVRDCKSREEAVNAIYSVMDEIRARAEATVREEGYGYEVSIELGEEYYPTKNYESCCFPEGEYTSLRVCIGDAEGQNWWCCLFPPLCLSAASEKSRSENEDAFISVGLSSDQYKIITETENTKYKVRFKLLETIQKLFD